MPCSNHNRFRRSILAVCFLFLNVICIASPVIKNTADDYKSIISVPSGQNTDTFESEENQLPRSSFVSRFFSRGSVTLKNHSCAENFNVQSSLLTVQKCSNAIIAASSLLQKPGYYTCLFLYNLF